MTYYEKPETTEEALAHYGIMGMRWGKHKAEELQLRELDKQSKARDKAARDASIDEARKRYRENARKDYVNAKAQYKIDKKTIGKREAAKKFNAVKQKNIDDYELGQQAKSGKETALAVLGIVGVVTLATIASSARAASRIR